MASQTALLVIDVQNDVVVNAHARDAVVGTIASLVDRARAESVPVIWVQHADEDLPEGSAGWEIVPELPVAEGEPVVHKQHGRQQAGNQRCCEVVGVETAPDPERGDKCQPWSRCYVTKSRQDVRCESGVL